MSTDLRLGGASFIVPIVAGRTFVHEFPVDYTMTGTWTSVVVGRVNAANLADPLVELDTSRSGQEVTVTVSADDAATIGLRTRWLVVLQGGVPVLQHTLRVSDYPGDPDDEVVPVLAADRTERRHVHRDIVGGGGGGGGAVDSVNGQTGDVVLDAADVGAAATVHAHSGDDITSGTVADARIASTIARDSEVTAAVAAEATARDAAIATHSADTTSVHGIADTAALVVDGDAAGGVLSSTYPNPGFAADMATQAELDAEAALARNADNLTSGTVADARIASTIARDSEVTSAVAAHESDTTSVHGIADTSALLDTGDLGVSVQGYDADTAAIAALTPTNDDVIQRKAGVWTNRTLAQLGSDLDLRSGVDGDQTEADTSTPGEIAFNVTADIDNRDSLSLNADDGNIAARICAVRLCTIAALPACTYANGASGVGATLTGNANGALADIDFTTPAAGDRLLVNNQAAPAQNGIYVVTQLGSAGTPFILTRWVRADVAADYTEPIFVLVGEGTLFGGGLLRSLPGSGATMGTTAISFVGPTRARVTPADVMFGLQRLQRRRFSDFEEITGTAVTTTATKITGTSDIIYLTGTAAQALQVGVPTGAETRDGVIDLQTGTTTSGCVQVQQTSLGVAMAATRPAYFSTVLKTPTAQTVAQNFVVSAGLLEQNATAAPAEGLFFRGRAHDGSSVPDWQAVTRTSGADTETTVLTGITQTTGYRTLTVIYDPITATAKFYSGSTLVATHTNIPAGAISPAVQILKTAGTTSRSCYVDYIDGDAGTVLINTIAP